MSTYDGWEIVRELGSGGQGTVYLVQNPAAIKRRQLDLLTIETTIGTLTKGGSAEVTKQAPRDLANAIKSYIMEDPSSFGALKVFKIPPGGPEAEKALGRLRSEVEALEKVRHPSLLGLVAYNLDEHWMITEYHPNGTLAQCRDRFKGKPGPALAAWRPLVEAVGLLHKGGYIHRDIKPENIFLASDERLVLGDFGIVFFQDEEGERLTATYERVGTRDWMAPWANVQRRLEEPNPTFDLFPLGKVLWAMISGERGLPYWYCTRDQYNLERLFPDDQGMALVNDLLKRCIVEHEKECLPSAREVLSAVDEHLKMLQRGGQLVGARGPTRCVVCGLGSYIALPHTTHIGQPDPHAAKLLLCDRCGNFQFFRFIAPR